MLRFEHEQVNLPQLVEQLTTENRISTELEVLQGRSAADAVIDSLGLRAELQSPRKGRVTRLFPTLRVAATADTGTLRFSRGGRQRLRRLAWRGQCGSGVRGARRTGHPRGRHPGALPGGDRRKGDPAPHRLGRGGAARVHERAQGEPPRARRGPDRGGLPGQRSGARGAGGELPRRSPDHLAAGGAGAAYRAGGELPAAAGGQRAGGDAGGRGQPAGLPGAGQGGGPGRNRPGPRWGGWASCRPIARGSRPSAARSPP